MKYYVYMLIDPSTQQPFYVGKGCDDRWKSHYVETLETTCNKRKFYKIRKLKQMGYAPSVVFVGSNLLEADAFALEKLYIEKFGRIKYDKAGILTNICLEANPPGMNSTNPVEHRKKLSNSLKGRKKPSGFGSKISKALKGKPKSAAHRKKIGEIHKGKTISVKQRDQLRAAMTGRKVSDETRERMKAAALLREKRKRENL